DGQDFRSGDCADGARRVTDVIAEMGRTPDRSLELGQPLRLLLLNFLGVAAQNFTEKGRSRRRRRLQPNRDVYGAYLSCAEMSLNLPLRVEPIVFTVAIITTEMPAAIRPYSIAVAPDSSFRNAKTLDIEISMWLKLGLSDVICVYADNRIKLPSAR